MFHVLALAKLLTCQRTTSIQGLFYNCIFVGSLFVAEFFDGICFVVGVFFPTPQWIYDISRTAAAMLVINEGQLSKPPYENAPSHI